MSEYISYLCVMKYTIYTDIVEWSKGRYVAAHSKKVIATGLTLVEAAKRCFMYNKIGHIAGAPLYLYMVNGKAMTMVEEG